MRVARISLALLLVLATVGATIARASVPRDPDKYFFDTTLGDFSDELASAKAQGKKGILLFFEQEECPFCHRMKTTVFNQPKVQDYFRKNFLVFSVDIESTVDITDFKGQPTTPKQLFAKVARNRGATPVMAFYGLDGKLLLRYTGATSGVDEFMWLGQYIADGVYQQNTSFTAYKRTLRAKERDQ